MVPSQIMTPLDTACIQDHPISSVSTGIATFAGGCFWCLEGAFQQLNGVFQVISGYMGGTTEYPTYQQVCTGKTGHAEVVQISFDPKLISYAQLLAVFFNIHDPTTLNRQGEDIGTQYRSVIFYQDADQQEIAARTIAELSKIGLWQNPIVTELMAVKTFWQAENYHQNYYHNNPQQPYCSAVVGPKLLKFRRKWRYFIKSEMH